MVKKWVELKNKVNLIVLHHAMQGVTTGILVIYAVIIAGFLLFNTTIHYYTWKQFFSSTTLSVASTLALLSLCWHSGMGLWINLNRYLKTPIVRSSMILLIVILHLFYFAWGINTLWFR